MTHLTETPKEQRVNVIGFSVRLNDYMKSLGLGTERSERVTLIMELMEVSEGTARNWLFHDKPPTNNVVVDFINKVEGKTGSQAMQIAAYLVFGVMIDGERHGKTQSDSIAVMLDMIRRGKEDGIDWNTVPAQHFQIMLDKAMQED